MDNKELIAVFEIGLLIDIHNNNILEFDLSKTFSAKDLMGRLKLSGLIDYKILSIQDVTKTNAYIPKKK